MRKKAKNMRKKAKNIRKNAQEYARIFSASGVVKTKVVMVNWHV